MDADVPVIEQVDPRRPEVGAALADYFAEIVERGVVTEIDAHDAEGVDDYDKPDGCFLLVYRGDDVIGCGALRSLAADVGELKRMWIRPDSRGRGLGSRLLDALVDQSRALGHTALLLDTNETLVEALALYRKHGFQPVARYNDNPDATHFLRKRL